MERADTIESFPPPVGPSQPKGIGIVCGFKAPDEKAGTADAVRLITAGNRLFVAHPETGFDIDIDGVGEIIRVSRASGVEIPERFVFTAGQVFYKNKEIVEVRLGGYILASGQDEVDGTTKKYESTWSTLIAPNLSADADGSISLATVDAGRTHISAAIVNTANDRLGISLLWDLRENAPEHINPRPRTASGSIVLRDEPTRIDRTAAIFAHHIADLKLPRTAASVPSLKKLTEEEIDRLLKEEKDLAFKDTREESVNGRAALLQKSTISEDGKRKDVITLTPAGKDALIQRQGHQWFAESRKDDDGEVRNYVVRHLSGLVRGSSFTASLSYYGETWPLIEGMREATTKQTEDELNTTHPQLTLPLNKEEEEKEKQRIADLESLLQKCQSMKDGIQLMRVLMYEFGAARKNPITMSLFTLRHHLQCESTLDGPRRVNGALRALRELRFEIKASKMGEFSGKTVGSFVSEYRETRLGSGQHVDGEFTIFLAPSAIGGLRAFALPSAEVKDPKALLLDWNKKLSVEDNKVIRAEPYSKGYSKLSPLYETHMEFSTIQKRLREWIEQEITFKKDCTSKGRRALQVNEKAIDAYEPREYDCAFCPLLPPGRLFHAALGHFPKGAERGRRLVTKLAPKKKLSPNVSNAGGLLEIMGYDLPKNSAKRDKTVKSALEDIRSVVETHSDGVVVAHRNNKEWLSLKDAIDRLSTVEILGVSWFIFLDKDWLKLRHERYNALQDKRHANGEVDTPVHIVGPDTPIQPSEIALQERLRKAMADRKLSMAKVGGIFGVSKVAVSKWLSVGPGKNITPLVEKWILVGEAPTAGDLAAIRKPGGGKGGRPSRQHHGATE